MESNKIWRILLDVWAEQHQVIIEMEEAKDEKENKSNGN